MDIATVDQVRLNFNPQGLFIINVAIGLMMFGVALELKLEDFKRIVVAPKAPCIGLAAQFILLPACTFVLTLILRPPPSIALGMMLVAACPGGNLSNIVTYLARGNCAVSVSMTAVSTAAAIIMTPFNLAFWGSLNPATAQILKKVSLSPFDVFVNIFIILGIPLILGLILARSIAIVAAALGANWQYFINYVGFVFFGVLVHNALALNLGYWSGRLARLNEADSRAVSIEVGIQNSGLGLVLVFNFFDGLGGMAIITAWWGIWHIIAGLVAAFILHIGWMILTSKVAGFRCQVSG
ncbi:MAG: bile acid:sodium symporter family protein [Desulfobacterales bacterium]